MKVEMKNSVQVLDRDNCYTDVSAKDLESVLGNPSAEPGAEQVSAIGEFRDSRFFPLLERAMLSKDPIILRRIASVAVKLKLQTLSSRLKESAKNLSNGMARSRIEGAVIYLEESDRGKKRLLSDDPLFPFIVTNLLAVVDFDEKDFELGLSALSILVNNQTNLSQNAEAWAEVAADSINGLRGYTFKNNAIPEKCKDEAKELFLRVRKHESFKKLDPESRRDLKELEKIAEG